MVVFSIFADFTCDDNSYVDHLSSNVCEVGEKSLLKDLHNLFIDTGILFENQDFVKTLGPFQGYLTSETIDMSVAFSKWFVTRTTGVSATAYMILCTDHLLTTFLMSRLCW